MKKIETLIEQLNSRPENTQFQDVIDIIDQYYNYSPTYFTNGPKTACVTNDAGENAGSCKIFSFSKLHNLDKSQTLHCFGSYYREDVLSHPEATDHANIRTFMKYGWNNIVFEKPALTLKA